MKPRVEDYMPCKAFELYLTGSIIYVFKKYLNKYLLSTYCVPGSMWNTRGTAVNVTKILVVEALIYMLWVKRVITQVGN